MLNFVMYFTRDPYESAVRRLQGLRLDYGSSFTSTLTNSAGYVALPSGPDRRCSARAQGSVRASCRAVELTVSKCFYNELLAKEGAQHLLPGCCCSQDQMW